MEFNPRTWYQSPEIAKSYDDERFRSVAGVVFDRLEKRAILRALSRVPNGTRILDIPCGTGRITELYLNRGFPALGMDLSEAMMEVARRKLSRFGDQVEFRRGDLAQLDLPDGAVGCASCMRFLCHFDSADRVQFLRSLARVSRCWVVLNIAYSNSWYRFRRRLKKFLRHANPIRFSLDQRQLQRELEAAGLRVVGRFYSLPLVSEDLVLLLEKNAS